MTTNTHARPEPFASLEGNRSEWGGPRPKVRDDDARGKHHSPKPGSGRTPKSFTLKLGDVFWKGQKDVEGNGIVPGEIWTVQEITRTQVVFASDNGDTYRLVR